MPRSRPALSAAFAALDAFARTSWRRRSLRTRERLEAFQDARVERLIAHASRRTRAYAGLRGAKLADLPIVDKAAVLDDFGAFNVHGIGSLEIEGLLARGERLPGIEVGQSTGTSGVRGYYVVSEVERFRWLGIMLAKVLPEAAVSRQRVAIVLPGPSPLYQSANESRILTLRHFDATRGIAALEDGLVAFGPTVLLGAPKSLRELGEKGTPIAPARVVTAAEVADATDREAVRRAFERPMGEVYMATEGLFGTSCPEGYLHLAEDVALFETVRIGDDPTLVTTLVTDFTRRTQVTARYATGDVLRLLRGRCACGSPMRRASVLGRTQDLIVVPHKRGRTVVLAPDLLRDAVAEAHPDVSDHRIAYDPADGGVLRVGLAQDLAAEAAACVARSLRAHLGSLGAIAGVDVSRQPLEVPFDRKLRRVTTAGPTWTR